MKKILIYLVIIASFGFLSSCEDSLSDLNIDPDRSPTANPQEVLTAAQGYISWAIDGQFNTRSFTWAQYLTWGPGVAVGEIERYVVDGADFNNVWSRVYANALTDLQFIENSEAEAHAGIAKILKAFLFQKLVDHFGDVPFTEALKGESDLNFGPVFDDDEAIYQALIPMIDEGIDKIVNAENSVGEEDLIFNGDSNQWIKFANSLKLKILMRQSNVNPSVSESVSELVSEGNFIEFAGDITAIPSEDVAGDQNPMWASMENGVGNFYVASNSTFIDLQSDQDPRLDAFYVPAADGNHNPIDQGSIDDEPFINTTADYSQMGPQVLGPDKEVILMSDWETWFLRAEAAEKFNTTDDATTAFENALTANLNYLEIEDSVVTVFATRKVSEFGSSGDRVAMIGHQKWISMNGLQESEGWIESRRFNNVNESFQTPVISELPEGVHPSIWLYPSSEISLNANSPNQRTDVTEKVFWDN